MVRHRTTTLHATPHYKPSQFTETPTKHKMIAAEEAVLTQTLALLRTLLIFGRTPKCFDTAVWFFLVLALNRRSHIHAELFNSYFLSAILLDQYQFRSLSRGQPQSPDVDHCVFIIFWLKGHKKHHKNEFLKTWNGLQTDPQTHRLTDT